MTDSLGFLAAFFFIGLFAWASAWQYRRDSARLRGSFDSMRFNGPDGPVKGHQLKVVKQVSYQPGENSAGLGARMGETFWYCVGPGQSYWLAMPMRMSRKGLIEWVVRPLTEERMRAALLGDRRALAALDAETTG